MGEDASTGTDEGDVDVVEDVCEVHGLDDKKGMWNTRTCHSDRTQCSVPRPCGSGEVVERDDVGLNVGCCFVDIVREVGMWDRCDTEKGDSVVYAVLQRNIGVQVRHSQRSKHHVNGVFGIDLSGERIDAGVHDVALGQTGRSGSLDDLVGDEVREADDGTLLLCAQDWWGVTEVGGAECAEHNLLLGAVDPVADETERCADVRDQVCISNER
jgi:hypothetical protein